MLSPVGTAVVAHVMVPGRDSPEVNPGMVSVCPDITHQEEHSSFDVSLPCVTVLAGRSPLFNAVVLGTAGGGVANMRLAWAVPPRIVKAVLLVTGPVRSTEEIDACCEFTFGTTEAG